MESTKYGAKNVVMVVCGNKMDVPSGRVISEKDGRDWATKNGCLFFETSAQSGENVKEMFDTLFREVLINLYGS